MRARRFITLLALSCAAALSCSRDGDFDVGPGSRRHDPAASRGEIPPQSFDKVMMLVSGGYNDLSSYLTSDQQDIEEAWLPDYTDRNVLVVLSRLEENAHSTTTAPALYRLSCGEDGAVRRDTLHFWTEDAALFSEDVLPAALEMIRRRFPARSYGMVASSHGTGWMPEKYYYYNKPPVGTPSLRSIGQDGNGDAATEMDMQVFIAAIPCHLDYLLMDCCLCGGVEVAWGLRGKADLVGFSQTEILAEGFDYEKIVRRLLGGDEPDPLAVCQDYFAQYDFPENPRQGSATISLVDTREMGDLATVCAALFAKYRAQLDVLEGSGDWGESLIQGYFRYERHYFYDLEDILVKVGITQEEHEQLTAALERCVLYKAHTPWFMYGSWYGFAINTHCGLSMYLPSMGTEYLDTYYKNNIAWNQATSLVP